MKTSIFLLSLLISLSLQAQEFLWLKQGEPPGEGKLEQMNWLTGYWAGPGLDGLCEEIWLPAVDNSMSGMFRYVRNGQIVFTEYMVLLEHDNSLTLKVKHFNRDLSAWEEKDEWIDFRLIRTEGQTAWFNGLILRREENNLTIKLAIKSGEELNIAAFSYTKQQL